MRLASAGDAPAVEIAIASGPWRTIAGRMKLHSGGTSTTFTSIARASASSDTAMFTSLSSVAAITTSTPSRSRGPATTGYRDAAPRPSRLPAQPSPERSRADARERERSLAPAAAMVRLAPRAQPRDGERGLARRLVVGPPPQPARARRVVSDQL